MRLLLILLFFGAGLCEVVSSQEYPLINGIPRDTSFTVQATYLKEKKYRPYIKIVEPKLPDGVSAYENVVYSTPYEGRKLLLNVYRPNNKAVYPALILVFGGGWSSGSLEMEIPTAQAIAKAGYVTIPVEYRLSPEAPYPAAVYDLKTAVRWARAHAVEYGIDTTKIAISGCSAGGQLAALVGVTNGQVEYEDKREYPEHSSSVQGVINRDGVMDFLETELNKGANAEVEKKKKPSAASRWLGSFETNKANWLAASSVNWIGPESAPICFINSSIPRFHDGRDEAINKLNKLNIYTEVHEIPDTPHPFWLFEPWFDTNISYMVGFLDKIFNGSSVLRSH